MTPEVALLIDRFGGVELPAMLFHGGDSVEGSAITLKGTEGGKLASIRLPYQTTDAFTEEEMWGYTAQGVDYFSKALKDMR